MNTTLEAEHAEANCNTVLQYRFDLSLAGNIPGELKERAQWVLWRYEPGKVPKHPRGFNAATDKPGTWSTFDDCVTAMQRRPEYFAGIGYVFTADDPYCGMDLDDCFDAAGDMKPWAREAFNQFGGANTYGEVSPSGTGIKCIIRGAIPGDGKNFGDIEMYDRLRFFTITGNIYGECSDSIGYGDEGIDELYNRLVKERDEAKKAKSEAKTGTTKGKTTDHGDKLKRCIAYFRKMDDSISGSGGHDRFFHAACVGVRFDLDDSNLWEALRWWSDNKSGNEPWNESEIRHKIDSAKDKAASQRGDLLRDDERRQEDRRKQGTKVKPQASDAGDEANDDNDGKPADDFLKVEFPELVPLDAAPLPKMPLDVFTGTARDMIEAVAAHTETPPEFGAATLLPVVGTCIQKKLSVRIENGYFEGGNIYTMFDADPASRKSHGQRPFIMPLLDVESRKAAEAQEEINRATSQRKTIEGRITKMRADAAKAKPGEFTAMLEEITKMEAELPIIPRPPQLVAQDITSENLATTMADNNEAMGLFSDEGGWLETIAGRYSNGVANMDIILQADSSSYFRQNRGSRPPVIMHHPALSIGLAVQPEVIRGLAAKPGFRGRGLLGRFQYFRANANIGYRKLEAAPMDDSIVRHYGDMITAMADLQPRTSGGKLVPHVIGLDRKAWEVWKGFQREVETMMRVGGTLEHAKDWAGKLPGKVARIALQLHALSFYSNPTAQADIDASTMERAVMMGRFLIPHALSAFGLMGADESVEVARHLLRVVESPERIAKAKADGKDPLFVTLSNLWHPLRGTYDSPAKVERGAQRLVDHGYLIDLGIGNASAKYRPRKFKVNPKAIGPPDI